MPATTVVKLLENVDVGSDYKNSFTFDSSQEQTNFFSSKSVETLSDYTYQRKDNFIRYQGNVSLIRNINYLMYQNPDYEMKWFYAFVERVEYVSEEVAKIYFETDVIQTWLFEMEFRSSYIEREHVSNDAIGANLVDEGLATGELIQRTYDVVDELEDIAYVVASTYNWQTGEESSGRKVTNNYSGIGYYSDTQPESVSFVNAFIAGLDLAGKADALAYVFTFPYSLLTVNPATTEVDTPTANVVNFSANKNSSDIDGYSPKNNKLFTYPYNFLELVDHRGRSNIYRYEYFGDLFNDCQFTASCDVAPSPTVTIHPLDYKGSRFLRYYDEPMLIDGYPICAISNDFFTNWYAQNQSALAIGAISGVAGVVGSAVVGNVSGVLAGGLSVAGQFNALYRQAIKPNPIKGSPSGGGNIAINRQNLGIYRKTITSEFAKMIDDYFTRYGYKTNRLKSPRLKTRQNWNYLKLYEANIVGNINQEDLNKIRNIFEAGITFWHNDNVGNYNRSNQTWGD